MKTSTVFTIADGNFKRLDICTWKPKKKKKENQHMLKCCMLCYEKKSVAPLLKYFLLVIFCSRLQIKVKKILKRNVLLEQSSIHVLK